MIYWDGKVAATGSGGGKSGKTTQFNLAESTVFTGRFFDGAIDEAALWGRALSPGDVPSIYASTLRKYSLALLRCAQRFGQPEPNASMMSGASPRIMLSYRRSDSAGITGRIFDRLAAHFGAESVFMDIDAIPLGVDFHKYIDDAIKTMDYVIVIIGPAWLGPLQDATTRLANPADPVRIEVQTALNNAVRIVPVLVEGARMPERDALPEPLKDMHSLNAARVSPGIDFEDQVERLIRSLEGTRSKGPTGHSALDRTLDNLPRQLTPLLGRDADVSKIESLLGEAPLVTITGPGGVGKTRVALEVASGLRHAYADGICFVDLAPLRNPELTAAEISSSLGIRDSLEHDSLTAIIQFLKTRNLALVVDNCEHLIANVAATISAIVGACPEVDVIATSREQLGVNGELVYRLLPLAMPPSSDSLTKADVLQFASVQLFNARAKSADANFTLTDENAAIVADLCRRLDGLPLAIELAAARVNVLSPREISDHLNERFRILSGGPKGSAGRQETLRGAIDWSFDLLAELEQILFCRMAIFAGGCTLESAESVCGFGRISGPDVLQLLASLIRKSLIVASFEGPATRYRMLESVRAYASEKTAAELPTLSERLTTWVVRFAERAADRAATLSQQTWLSDVGREIDNIRLALEWSTSIPNQAEAAGRIVGDLAMFWHDAAHQAEGDRWIQAVLPKIEGDADPLLAGRLWRATALNTIGRAAVTASERAIGFLERSGNRRETAGAFRTYAYSLFQTDRLKDADRAAIHALELYGAEGLQGTREYADTLATRATIVRGLGSNGEARRLFDSALKLFTSIGDERGTAMVKGNLAELEFASGDARAALRLARAAADTFHRLGATTREATALVNAATYHLDLLEIDQARDAAEQALIQARRTGATPIISVAIQNIAAVAAFGNNSLSAAKLIGYVDEWYKKMGYTREWSEQQIWERISTMLAQRLSDNSLEEARAAGAMLTEDEAALEALAGTAPGANVSSNDD